jgi:predicted RecB family nuclease
MSKPFAWSYSVLTSFEDCPRRHYLTKVSKQVSEQPSEEMTWGNQVHKALELRIKVNQPLPKTMVEFEPIVAKVATAEGVKTAEQKLALNRDYQPTTYFAGDVYVRGITDVTIENGRKAVILDYKTGKPTPASAQLKLTAAMTFAHLPYIDTIATGFLWLKTGGITSETYTRDDIPTIWQEFEPRVQRLERALIDNKFPPRPSGLCRKWCPVGRALCEHCGT